MVDKPNHLKLPEVPDNFCFKETEFENECEDFEDQFIKRHQNDMPLEQLREDLSIYLRKLRLSLVDLINCDYEEFINLTTNFVDLNNNINNLTYSISKLKDDVEQYQREIQATIDKLNENLNYIRQTIKQKKDLHFILKSSRMIDCIESDLDALKNNDRLDEQKKHILDQNFNKVAYQLNLINQKLTKLSLNSTYVNQTFRSKLNDLNGELNCYLDKKIDQFIDEENVDGLNQVLESVVLNQQFNQFVDLIYKKVFQVKLQEFICDLNIDKYGIIDFYDQLYQLCDNGFKLFKNVNTFGLNLVDSLLDYLSEKIYYDLTVNASTLFLAGNPNTFILNFKETIKFFRRLLSCNSKNRKPESFKVFNEINRKFNCEIYFHIRLSEISNELARSLEKPIQLSNNQQLNQNQLQIKVQLTDDLLKILNYIWSDQIYLDTLFFDFWRLTLLLISRYTLFLKQFQFDAYIQQSNLNYPIQSSILIRLITESSLFINSIQQIYSNAIKLRVPKNCNEFELTSCLNESFESIFLVGLPSINSLLKQVFCIQCSSILNQIKEIPRLYRKTNRDKPNKPSGYILTCIELFQQLKQIQKCSANLILDILNEVTNNFYSLTNEVLESLQKMEESLMRLKKVQQTSNGGLTNKNLDKKATMSDADKIRLQFKLDVNYYLNNAVGSLNVDKRNLVNLDALVKLIENF